MKLLAVLLSLLFTLSIPAQAASSEEHAAEMTLLLDSTPEVAANNLDWSQASLRRLRQILAEGMSFDNRERYNAVRDVFGAEVSVYVAFGGRPVNVAANVMNQLAANGRLNAKDLQGNYLFLGLLAKQNP